MMDDLCSSKMIQEHLRIQQYYVVKKDTTVTRISGKCDVNVSNLKLGMLIESVCRESDDLSIRIRIKDQHELSVWSNTVWNCHTHDLILVSKKIWQYLAAVSDNNERVKIANNKKFCKDIENIHVNDKVWYSSNGSSSVELAIINLIGPVPELGNGVYFCLELLESRDLLNGFSVKFAAVSSITPCNQETLDTTISVEKNFLHNDMGKTKRDYCHNSGNSRSNDCVKVRQETNDSLFDKYGFDDNTNNNRELISFAKDVSSEKMATSDNGKGSRNSDDYNLLHFDDETEKEENKHGLVSDIGNLCIGSNVKVLLDKETRSGVVRWIGMPRGLPPGKTMAAVELDDDHYLGTDGIYKDERYFECRPQRAFFTDIKKCHKFDTSIESHKGKTNIDNFGNMESSVVAGMVRPISVKGDLEKICGKNRGIQGHHNSCYLDATLFSMFTFTSVFDNLLFRPQNVEDCEQYEEVQRVLREEIVNPLRKNFYVRADRVMKLRTLLEKLSSISGLTSEEKDPEEFLTSLVAQILNAEPFLKLSSGQEAYHYQLFVEKDEHLSLPTVQHLLEQSFLTSNIRLKEVPSCLIIQMPRFGKSFKMYPKIQPTLLLDVTDIIEDSPRQCTVCSKLAVYECKQCYGECGDGLESIAFCIECLETAHKHERRINHKPKELKVPMDYTALQEHCPVPRLFLELFAVVCIETSHYVSFVKCGPGSEAPWCFFDSMADRKGEQNGYNIPEMVPCPDFPHWLSEEGANKLSKVTDDRQLPEHAKRLFCDAYMCMYQSPDVMMYK
ncbi:ubiquitin carboxyl-terminal hydrolase CYLD [Leptopilina heterotoma]|uniref:ubiquitin carboxyl-terminal hydrolase CYLD n=1 Tax=Leptopilina heterotoma TaxID=63436 RepID=UPI001CA8C0CD|nr:ubiquitin carboxyl-terminal hydrolase CYLD [Leptopilina heterotoma]XP_043462907.1 ubiquitin carboxyl-terminal hydrolase CYLD [Leptopilina heterotoma]